MSWNQWVDVAEAAVQVGKVGLTILGAILGALG